MVIIWVRYGISVLFPRFRVWFFASGETFYVSVRVSSGQDLNVRASVGESNWYESVEAISEPAQDSVDFPPFSPSAQVVRIR